MREALDSARRRRAVWCALLSSALWGCAGDREIRQPTPLDGDGTRIEYPLELWDQGIEGETLLRVRVTDTGRVDSVEVVQSSGFPAFDSAAIRGAVGMRFEPARKGNRRIEVWAQVPVHFSKNNRPGSP